MKLSIIIVNYHAGDFLARCLASIQRHLQGLEKEVCVVDNGSASGEREKILSGFPAALWISNTENAGFSKAVNQGVRATSGEFVLWLNPDAEFMDSGLADVLKDFEKNPEWGVLGLKILDPDGSVQLSARAFPSYEAALFNRYSILTRIFPGNPWSRRYLNSAWKHDEVRSVDWVSGAALVHRRKVWEVLKGLDEAFFMYCEDVDFCLRAGKAGWRVLYHPAAAVRHHIGVSSRKLAVKMVAERHKSMWHYYRKNFSRNLFKDMAVGAGITARCGLLLCLACFQNPGKRA